jgi:hypothetical protein
LISSYARMVRKGIKPCLSGRPARFDDKDLVRIKNLVDNPEYKIGEDSYLKEVNQIAKERQVSDRGLAPCEASDVSKRSLARYEKLLGISTAGSADTTLAREKATEDIRHTVSFMAAQYLMVPLTDQYLILNVDSSQFTVGRKNVKTTRVKFLTKSGRRDGLKCKNRKKGGIVSYFIKYHMLISAGGINAEPIYHLADDSMDPGELETYEIPGLGIGTNLESKGHLVFSSTRAGNVPFFRWFTLNILVPFVQAVRRKRGLLDSSPAFLQMDGESIQIQCYEDPEVLAVLELNNIVIGKGPASTSSKTQAADAGDCFRGSKKTLKKIDDESVADDIVLESAIKRVFDQHMAKRKEKMTYAHQLMARKGLMRVQLALQSLMKPYLIKKSFEKCGIYDYQSGGINFARLLAQCNTRVSPEMEKTIKRSLPGLAELLKNKGELHGDDFDFYDIAKAQEVDQLCLNRRRYVFLTNKKLVKSEALKKQKKIEAEESKKKTKGKNSRKKAKIEEPMEDPDEDELDEEEEWLNNSKGTKDRPKRKR